MSRRVWPGLLGLLGLGLLGLLGLGLSGAAFGSAGKPAPLPAPDSNPAALFNTYKVSPPYLKRIEARPDQLWPAVPDVAETAPVEPDGPSKTVRVYYSDPLPESSEYRDGGSFHAVLLANLLGQYSNVKVIRAPISQYQAGDAASSLRTFYIGTVYNEKIPAAFLSEVKAGAPVTWLGYNIWELGDISNMGLVYKKLHTALTPDDIAAAYSNVKYKNYTYRKYPARQELSEVSADPARTQTLAVAIDAAGDELPYLIRSGKFYFVADNPFEYIQPTSPYLVLADSLKTMLGDATTQFCKKRAVLRLEDLTSLRGPQGLKDTLDVIEALKVPFAMTVIPESYYGGVFYPWAGNVQSLMQIYRAVKLGGVIIQHGDTHNYHGLRTPEGNSGEEWELWDKENNRALSKLTPESTLARLRRGREVLLKLGLRPRLWTTPHYEAAVNLYPAINALYPRVIERRMYQADGVRGGQFFPYPVRDIYGTLVLPENLGNIQVGYLSDAVLDAAEANSRLNCAYASFFVHPYLLENNHAGPDKLTRASLKKLITDIQAKGYTFVSPLDITLRALK